MGAGALQSALANHRHEREDARAAGDRLSGLRSPEYQKK